MVIDCECVRIGEGIRSKYRFDEQIKWHVTCNILQNKENDLVNQNGHDDEDEAHVVVHGNGRGQKDDKGDNEDAKVELLDLEVVFIVSLS